MKKSSYINYRKASKYFTDKERILADEIQKTENQKKFIDWVQEFSKKIVVVAFVLYIINNMASLIAIFITMSQGSIYGLDTFISESNQTFRDVVGGYIIKSAVENAFKIAGNYFIGICDARLKALKTDLEENEGVKGLSETTNPYDTEQNDCDNEVIEYDSDI